MTKKIGTDFHMVANDIYQAYDEGKEPQEKDLTELYELSKEFVKDYEEKEKDMTKEIDKRITDLHKKTKLQEYNKLTECLESLVGDLQRFKVSTDDAVGSLKALVSYYSNLEGFCEKETKEITYAQITSFTNAFQHTCSDGWITYIVNGEVDIDKLKSFILNHYEEHKDDEGKKVLDEDIEGYFTKDNCDEIFVKTKKGKKKKERQDPIEDEPMCTVCHSSDVYSLSEDDEPYVGHCNECEEDRDLEICELDEKGKVK